MATLVVFGGLVGGSKAPSGDSFELSLLTNDWVAGASASPGNATLVLPRQDAALASVAHPPSSFFLVAGRQGSGHDATTLGDVWRYDLGSSEESKDDLATQLQLAR